MTDSLGAEVGRLGIEVVLVEPGPVKTRFSDKAGKLVSAYNQANSPDRDVYDRVDESFGRSSTGAVVTG